MASESLLTTSAVIAALGGTVAVARLTGRRKNAVSNWHGRQYFPPNTFVRLTEALDAKGLSAPSWLWQMTDPPSRRRKARVEVRSEVA
jgi:hypothetical protein